MKFTKSTTSCFTHEGSSGYEHCLTRLALNLACGQHNWRHTWARAAAGGGCPLFKKMYKNSPLLPKGRRGVGYFLLLRLARKYLGLCLHMYKSSERLLIIVLGSAIAIVVFSTKQRSQCLEPGLKGIPLAFIDQVRSKIPASRHSRAVMLWADGCWEGPLTLSAMFHAYLDNSVLPLLSICFNIKFRVRLYRQKKNL